MTSITISSVLKPAFEEALKKGDVETLKDVLHEIDDVHQRVALVNEPSRSGSTPLFGAAWDGNIAVARALLHAGGKVNWCNLRGNTAICMAIEQNHVDFCRLLLENGASGFKQQNPTLVQQIRLATKKDIDQAMDDLFDEFRLAAERRALEKSMNRLYAAVEEGSAISLTRLLKRREHQNNINKQDDENGNTVLHDACQRGLLDIVKVLVAHKADYSIRNGDGHTPLVLAIAYNHRNICRELLVAGADTRGVSMKDIRFWSPINISKRIDLLLSFFPPKKKMSQSQMERIDPLILAMTPHEAAVSRELFQYMDKNGDGMICIRDLRASLGDNRHDVQMVVDIMRSAMDEDTTDDDELSIPYVNFVHVLDAYERQVQYVKPKLHLYGGHLKNYTADW